MKMQVRKPLTMLLASALVLTGSVAAAEEMTPEEKNAAAMEKFQPKVVTLDNGVQVQKVPNDPFLWNTKGLDAEHRGCAACHDITEMIQQMDITHPELKNPYNVDETIDFCFMCHYAALNIGDSMHTIHMNSKAFQQMGGSCNSCHYIDTNSGEMELWDHVKYDVMMGITPVANVQGNFTCDQDYITPNEEVFWYWENNDHRGITPNNPTDPEILGDWEISIEGLVDEPFTFKMSDYMDLSETRVIKMHCVTNGPGGAYAANLEVTGIPIKPLLEKAGVKAEATAFNVYAEDNWVYPLPVDYLKDNDVFLVYEINGQPLTMEQGYPVQFWGENIGSVHYCKRPTRIALEDTPAEPRNYVLKKDGQYINKPNCGIWHYTEGTVFPFGEPVQFEGYADAYDEPIVALEISMDNGKTWTRYDTPDMDTVRLVHWTYEFTPENPGSYVMQVRAITDTGLVSPRAAKLLFNVK